MGDEESEFLGWARAEVKRAGLLDEGSDYDGMLGESVLRLCETFDGEGHSGFSAMAALQIFSRLGERRPLTPITSDPDEWQEIAEDMIGQPNVWQSRRASSCFSNDGGRTYYDIEERQVWWRRLAERLTLRRMGWRWAKRHRAAAHA